MTRLIRLLLAVLIFVFAAGEIFSQGGQDRSGTSAAPQLKIPVGGQYLAMSGSAVSIASGPEAIYWNPAGVYHTATNASALFSYRSYIADMSMSYAAITGNFGDFGTLGVSFRNLNVGDINVTTLDQPDGTGEIISPTYFVLGLTYSKLLSDRVSIGANLNLINESWANVKATGFSVDAGVQYRDLFTSGLSIGVVVKNLGGAMQYDGSGLFIRAADPVGDRGNTFYKVVAASFELPSEIGLGVSYIHSINSENSLLIAGAFVNNNFAFDDYKVGLEYSYKNTLFLRGGYLFSPQSTDERMNIWEDFTLGIGLNLKDFSDLDISLDYAYVPVQFFDANNTFSIKVNF
jgi:hypothetical protein